jgi:hypothetical protein
VSERIFGKKELFQSQKLKQLKGKNQGLKKEKRKKSLLQARPHVWQYYEYKIK